MTHFGDLFRIISYNFRGREFNLKTENCYLTFSVFLNLMIHRPFYLFISIFRVACDLKSAIAQLDLNESLTMTHNTEEAVASITSKQISATAIRKN